MHLSYRGIVYQASFDGHSKEREKSSEELLLSSIYWPKAITAFLSRVLDSWGKSESTPLDFSRDGHFAPVRISQNAQVSPNSWVSLDTESQCDVEASAQQLKSSELNQRLYRMERSLQLAYAVGDRSLVQKLEAEIETVTGWRFERERAWLKR